MRSYTYVICTVVFVTVPQLCLNVCVREQFSNKWKLKNDGQTVGTFVNLLLFVFLPQTALVGLVDYPDDEDEEEDDDEEEQSPRKRPRLSS